MSTAAAQMAGIKGCDMQTGAGTITAPAGKKIKAIGVHLEANVTNYKYTPKDGNGDDMTEVTVTAKNYLGTALTPSGPTSYIPFDHPADKVTLASGTIFYYYG